MLCINSPLFILPSFYNTTRIRSHCNMKSPYDYEKKNHANIEGFILLDNDESKVAKYAKRFINENGYTQKIEDEKATFYAIEL